MTAATSRAWLERAGCRGVDPELFFPHAETGSDLHGEQVVAAKAVCMGCPVRGECLEFALAALTYGIAGGLDEHERRALRRSRSTTGAAPEIGPSSEMAALAREGRAAGRSPGSLAAELGVSTRTVGRWTRTGAA